MNLDEAMQIIAQQQKDIEIQGKRIESLENTCQANAKDIIKLCLTIEKNELNYFES